MSTNITSDKASGSTNVSMMEGKPVIIQGDGSSLWTATFNTDFAIGYTGLMGNRHAIGEAFQITGDESLTWDQIYQTIADALGVELKAYHVASDFLSAAGDKYGFDLRDKISHRLKAQNLYKTKFAIYIVLLIFIMYCAFERNK